MSYFAKYITMTAAMLAVCACAFGGAYLLFVRNDGVPETGVEIAGIQDLSETTESAEAYPPADAPSAPEAPAVEAATVADRISESTNIVYEYYYADEDKTERAVQKAPTALLNLTREQLIARIEGFSVVSFSPGEVVLRKNVKNSGKKYIIGELDGHVAVFYSGPDVSVKEITDTPVSSLSEYEQERLKDGIVVESEAELMKALEDYGS